MLGRYYKVFCIINKYLRNRYWFAGSVLFFLLAASAYLLFSPSSYKITARAVLNGKQYPEEAIEDIRSKLFIRKAIDQLPMVRYYHSDLFKQTEINKDSLPFKLVFSKYRAVDSSAQAVITILNDRQYEINENNVLMDVTFDKAVNCYSFAKFTVVKGPAFSVKTKPVTLVFNQPDQLLEEYYNNLDVNFAGNDHKTIVLSLATPSLRNGKDFLNKLVEVYNKSENTTNRLLRNKITKAPEVATPQQTITEKLDEYVTTYPKTGYVYLFALLGGLALALIIPYFKRIVRYD